MDGQEKELSILLVEDNRADIYLFKAALKDVGVPSRVHVMINGAEAWKHLSESLAGRMELPDLIVLDLNLPGMNGREILAGLANDPRSLPTPIAVFTGSISEQDIPYSYPQLRVHFAVKTPDYTQLQDIVREFVRFARSTPAAN